MSHEPQVRVLEMKRDFGMTPELLAEYRRWDEGGRPSEPAWSPPLLDSIKRLVRLLDADGFNMGNSADCLGSIVRSPEGAWLVAVVMRVN